MSNFEYRNLKKIIDQKQIVSFDMFDTLIKRYTKSPSDIFDIVEYKYNKISNSEIEGFKLYRINAEKKAREKYNREVTLTEIYNELNINNVDKNILKQIEEETEIESCFPNEEMMIIYNYSKNKNKKIIIISDMYLSKKVLEQILKKNGIKYDELLVSSDVKLTKSNGTIYKCINKLLGINKNEMIHIGDNYKSDYLMPKLCGIKSFLYKGINKSHDNKKIYYLNQMIDSMIDTKNKDLYYEFGYKNLGPLVYGFCEYLSKNIPKDKKIFFLAREGKFIKECADLFNYHEKNEYIYVSRKSISSSIIDKFENFQELCKSQSITRSETMEMFLKRTGLLCKKNIDLLEKNNIDKDSSFFDRINQDFMKQNFELLKENKELKENNMFQKYLKQLKFDSNSVIVDIGWSGTMQDMIQKVLLETNVVIEGYYFGVRKKRYNEHKHGYIYDQNREQEEIYSRSMNDFLEIVFAANHGSTIGYKLNSINNKIEPVLDENDISENIMKKILMIQAGAKRFITDYKRNKCFKYKMNSYEYSYNFYQIGLNPDEKNIKLFNDFFTYDQKRIELIGGKKISKYILHPKQFITDYIESGWKNAFLKKVLKLNLPYYKIFKLLYKIEKKR